MPVEQALLLPERIAPGQFTGDEIYGDVCADSEASDGDLPGLRLIRVPDVGPPFDGEPLSGAAASLAGGHFGHGFGWGCPSQAADATAVERTRVGPVTSHGPCTRPEAASHEAAPLERVEASGEWPVQFARLLIESLAGARPVRQIMPWTSERARGQLRRLLPLFGTGQRPRVLRVITKRPTREVIEMAVIVRVGARTRALAIRLERAAAPRQLLRCATPAVGGPGRHDPQATANTTATALRWVCTDIETA